MIEVTDEMMGMMSGYETDGQKASIVIECIEREYVIAGRRCPETLTRDMQCTELDDAREYGHEHVTTAPSGAEVRWS